jgi:hypothetical protein
VSDSYSGEDEVNVAELVPEIIPGESCLISGFDVFAACNGPDNMKV